MKIAYIAGAYRSDSIYEINLNIQTAEQMAVHLWQRGFAVICPHKNSAFLDGCVKDEMFLKGYLEILKKCDVMFMLPGWEKSEGAIAEHSLAVSLSIDIIYDL